MNVRNWTLVFIGIFAGSFAHAAIGFVLKESVTEYQVHHPAHTVKSSSKESRGKVQCDDKRSCEFLVAVPVRSFDSDSGGRDQHMLEVTKASMNPMVQMKGHFTLPSTDVYDGTIDPEVTFAGVTKKYTALPLNWKKEGVLWRVTGQWSLKLSDFNIERPALLLVPVDDVFKIGFSQVWAPQ